jgi:hypothetical protein
MFCICQIILPVGVVLVLLGCLAMSIGTCAIGNKKLSLRARAQSHQGVMHSSQSCVFETTEVYHF